MLSCNSSCFRYLFHLEDYWAHFLKFVRDFPSKSWVCLPVWLPVAIFLSSSVLNYQRNFVETGWGGWVRQWCLVPCVTRVSNWYSLTVGQGLSLHHVRVEGQCFYFFCFYTFIHFPLSRLSLSFISSTISSVSLLPFFERRHKMTHKGWRVFKPKHNQLLKPCSGISLMVYLCLNKNHSDLPSKKAVWWPSWN